MKGLLIFLFCALICQVAASHHPSWTATALHSNDHDFFSTGNRPAIVVSYDYSLQEVQQYQQQEQGNNSQEEELRPAFAQQHKVVQLQYVDSVEQVGWGYLLVNTTWLTAPPPAHSEEALLEDEHTMFVAGYLEGHALAARIWQMYQLQSYNAWLYDPLGPVPSALLAYMEENIAWTWAMAAAEPFIYSLPQSLTEKLSQVGQQQQKQKQQKHEEKERQKVENDDQQLLFQGVRLAIAHVEGQLAGYNANGSYPKLSLAQLVMLHAAGDLEDLVPLLTGNLKANKERDMDCSMLIKLTSDDLILGHTTWRQYGLMLRTLKQYHLGLVSPQFNSHLSLSSSPGFGLESKDDFYVISDPDAQLLVGETTLSVYNKSLFQQLTPLCLLTWVRTVACGLTSKNGDTWTRNFGFYVSSSYNNGFAVIDLKLATLSSSSIDQNPPSPATLTPKAISTITTLQPGTFWYVEQMPGVTERGDLTSMLLNNSYAGFYNVAFFPHIRQISGYDSMEQQQGDAYSYWNCDRAKIFRELQPLATDWFSVASKIMRYNNYLKDPIANGNPASTISSRYDLRSSKPDAFGGVDSKGSSLQAQLNGYAMAAQSGPTQQGSLPPFTWSTSLWANHTQLYAGLPDCWDFDWVLI